MKRRLLILLMAFILTACTPELIPGPTTAPATPTVAPPSGALVPAPGLVSIRMLDPQNGWGISDTAVLRTSDGGLSWHDSGPQNPGQLGYFVSSSFLDQLRAWVLIPDATDMLSGALYRTSDGGVTWEQIAVPFGGGDLHFLDPKHGWMLASLGAGAGSMGVAVFQTSDAGATWSQTFTNDPNKPNAGDSLPLGGLKDGLTAVDMQAAWIGGVVYTPGLIYLYRSQDAGATWQLVPVTVPEGYDQGEFETRGPLFPTINTGYLPVTISSQNGVMLAVYVSRDGGNSWLLTPTLVPQGGAMDFVSPQDGFVWNGTDFYVTHDGAQSWSTVSPDVAFAENFSGMDFVTDVIGFVVTGDASGAHALYKTTDGGSTWNIISK